MNLTPRQISLVQSTFRKLDPIAKTFAELFYTRLFALEPGLRVMFKDQDEDWERRGESLKHFMAALVSNLNKLDCLKRAVQALARSSFGRMLRPSAFDAAGQALIWTLARGLEDEFTDETKLAWLDAYSLLAETLADSLATTVMVANSLSGAPGRAGLHAG
ncbi:MAG TPA: globin domain-containing protein [Burkholderiales bacterium]|nr:globin domain-containing protein [Burkholderiales bacterium]